MVGCLPDSISKFEEDTAEDTSTSTSTDTETEDDDAVEATPAPATPTPPTTIAYPDDDLPIHMEINETTLSLEPSIVIPDDTVSKEQWHPKEADRYGIAYGLDDITYSKESKNLMIYYIKAQEKESFDAAQKFASKCIEHFIKN